MITSDEQIQENTTKQIESLLNRFAQAQRRPGAGALSELLTDDFELVGPLGFVVPKQQWLAQFTSGALQIESLDWDEIELRTYGYAQVAIAVGRLTQAATYAERPADGQFRVTVIALRHGPGWQLAGAHYSGIPARQPDATTTTSDMERE
jgi:ketosteroid isomerase-like protein